MMIGNNAGEKTTILKLKVLVLIKCVYVVFQLYL